MTESGQLDLIAILEDQTRGIDDGLVEIEDTLNPQIDANPNDKLLMEMLDIVTDAHESIKDLQHLLATARQRDQAEVARA